MNILIVSQYFWPETFRITEVAESLTALGCTVTVLTGQPNYPEGKVFSGYRAFKWGGVQHEKGCRIYRVPIVPRGKSNALRLAINYVSYVLSASVLGPLLLRGQKFDVVFVYAISPILQGIPAALLSRLKGAAHVIWVQDLWPQSLKFTGFVKSGFVLGLVGYITSRIYRSSDMLLVQSLGFVEDVRSKSSNTEIRYHPNPAELGFGQGERNEEPGIRLTSSCFNVVFAGNFGTAQALPTILEAATRLAGRRDIRITLIGSGSMSTWLVNAVRERGLSNVDMPGRFPVEAMPDILAQADALLVTLVRDEALAQIVPSKVSTYLAAGKPIIAALDGQGGDVIRDANAGIAVPAEDPDALAGAIERLSGMSVEDRRRMGQSAREYYEVHFEPTRLAKLLIGHFEDAIRIRRL